MRLEMRGSQMDDYRRIAFFHHLIFTKEKVQTRNRGNCMDVETELALSYNDNRVKWKQKMPLLL